jgi:hypothetical protein
MSKMGAILNGNAEDLAPLPPLDDGCLTQICPLSLPSLQTLLHQIPLAEPDAQQNSTLKLPALQDTEPSLKLPSHSSSFGVTSVAESQPNLTPSLHARSNREISIYSCTTAETGSFDARHGPSSACPSLREDFSTTTPSLTSGHERALLLPSSTLSEQTDSIKQQHLNPYPVIDYETASKKQDEKRRRNMIASRRYRERKNDRIQDLAASMERLQRDRDFYYEECCFYYDFIVHHIGSNLLPPRPRPPVSNFGIDEGMLRRRNPALTPEAFEMY